MKKKVRILVSMARPFDTLNPGDVCELPEADAELYISFGFAEPVEAAMKEPKVERAVKDRARGRG